MTKPKPDQVKQPRLERYNRCLRRRARVASAYHSDAGLKAMITHEVAGFNAVKLRV